MNKPIKLKLHLARKDIPARKFARATANAGILCGRELIGRSKFNQILNGDAYSPQQKTTINYVAGYHNIMKGGIFDPCTEDQIAEIQALQSNTNGAAPPMKTPGHLTVAHRIIKQWNITPAILYKHTRFKIRDINALIKNGPTTANESVMNAINEFIQRNRYPINIQTLWEPMEEIMPESLNEETLDRFNIKEENEHAFSKRLTKNNLARPFKWPAYNATAKKISKALSSQDAIAIIGPSGSGKTICARNVIKRLENAEAALAIIKPVNVQIENMTLNHIMTAICTDINTKPRGPNLEAITRNCFDDLVAHTKKDLKHAVIVIEDAHRLHPDVIRSLKLFLEWQNAAGMNVLGILLIAQPEMKKVMGADTEQFWKRCHVEWFPPLCSSRVNKPLRDYIKYVLENAGTSVENVFAHGAFEAFCQWLISNQIGTPLDVTNALIAQMNKAAMGQGPYKIDKQSIASTSGNN